MFFRLLPWEYAIRNLFRRPLRTALTFAGLTTVLGAADGHGARVARQRVWTALVADATPFDLGARARSDPRALPWSITDVGLSSTEPQGPPPVREAPRREALTDTERQILLNLMDRKRQLDERDALLNQREEQLRALRDNIQQQVAELKRLQADIEASMDAKKAQDAENLQKVVNLYNGMDPNRAAEKLEQLESKYAVQILVAMNQRKAAQLLEALPPATAKRITESIVSKVPLASNQ